MADLAFLCSAASPPTARAAHRAAGGRSGSVTGSASRSRSGPCSAVPGGRRSARARGAAVLRVGGLALCVAGRRRLGTGLLVAGCCVPPRATAPAAPVARLTRKAHHAGQPRQEPVTQPVAEPRSPLRPDHASRRDPRDRACRGRRAPRPQRRPARARCSVRPAKRADPPALPVAPGLTPCGRRAARAVRGTGWPRASPGRGRGPSRARSTGHAGCRARPGRT